MTDLTPEERNAVLVLIGSTNAIPEEGLKFIEGLIDEKVTEALRANPSEGQNLAWETGYTQGKAEGAAEALTKAADDWQWGEWAEAPRREDRVQERIANGQFVTDWLRARVDREGVASAAPSDVAAGRTTPPPGPQGGD